jgi:hypothetical protein
MKFLKTVSLALLLSASTSAIHAANVFRISTPGTKTALAAVPAPQDPDRAKVRLLTQFEGAEGAKIFADSSGTAGVGTATGTARISSVNGLFGGTSLALDGASAVTYGYSTSANAVQDFTAEFWVRNTVSGTAAWATPMCGGLCFTKFDGGWGSGYGNGAIYTNDLYFEPAPGSNGQKLIVARNGQWNDGRWHHVAVSRQQGLLRGFLDGIQVMPAMTAAWAYPAYPLSLGRGINGGLDDVRVTIGLARYTAPFTPPSSSLPY